MKKLLHERLREWANSDEPNYRPMQEMGIIHGWSYGRIEGSKFLNELADEIERYYIPRPRFEDGEPIQFGDVIHIWKKEITTLNNFMFCSDGRIYLNDYIEDPTISLEGGEALERPQPKVYDADGVEIKVGDTVYRVEGDWFGHVEGFETDGCVEDIVLCDSMKSPAKFLTHKKPVLDADGVPINVGDTVWDIEDGTRSIVESVTMIDSDGNTICCKDNCIGHLHYKPDQLTHKEPDSIEKLRDDINQAADDLEFTPYKGTRDRLIVMAERLSAIIERSA